MRLRSRIGRELLGARDEDCTDLLDLRRLRRAREAVGQLRTLHANLVWRALQGFCEIALEARDRDAVLVVSASDGHYGQRCQGSPPDASTLCPDGRSPGL